MTGKTQRLMARDLMHHDVAYVNVDMTLVDLAAFLEENAIHGAPVVGAKNQLVGVVSRTDLVRAITEGKGTEPHLTYFRMLNDEGEFEESSTDIDPDNFPGAEMTVGEIMSTNVVTVRPDWTAGKIAEQMMRTGVSRVLVLENGGIAGILSATDLLEAVASYEKGLR